MTECAAEGPGRQDGAPDHVLVPVSPRSYFVYILASPSGTLYVGVTGDLCRRLAEHRQGTASSFTRRYGVNRLVHCESYGFVGDALRREKQIKGWLRAKKIALIEAGNPRWEDLGDGPLPDPSLRSG